MDDISSSIKNINRNIDLISDLHDSSLVSINEQQWKQNSRQLSQFVEDTSNMNNSIKNRIKALESSNARHPKNSDLNIRRAQVHDKKLVFSLFSHAYIIYNRFLELKRNSSLVFKDIKMSREHLIKNIDNVLKDKLELVCKYKYNLSLLWH